MTLLTGLPPPSRDRYTLETDRYWQGRRLLSEVMGMTMLADCPECGLPATVSTQGRAASTGGPVEMIVLRCVIRHWFLGPADLLWPAAHPIEGRVNE